MPSRTAQGGIWVIAALLVAIVAFIAVLPSIASTQIVRNRIAQELSDWSGYRVVLRGAPRFDVWPSFNAILSDVAFQEWGKPDSPPVLQTERIDIELSAFAALLGNIAFTEVSLVRPVLRVSRSGGAIPLPAAPGGGRMTRAIETAQAVVDANPAQPDMRLMPADPLGTIEFSDGRIVLAGAGGEDDLVSSLTGKASWPTLNRAGALQAKGIWRGEEVSVDLSAAQPLALFAGGNTRVTLALTSSPLTATYDGLATLSRSGFVDGTAKLSSPSLRRALEWSQTDISPGAAVGNASIAGRVTGDAQRMKIENAEIVLGGHPGNGVLDFSFAGKVPAVAGTLAFDSFDVGSFLSAFMPLSADGARWTGAMDTSFTSQIDVDLRLSAARASAGPISLSGVAATAQVKDGLAAFDISDASAFGGTIQTGFRIDRRIGQDSGEIRLLASDVDIAPLAALAGLKRPMPQAKGTISVLLKGHVGTRDSFFADADGTISVRLGKGSLAGIDLDAFVKRTQTGGFFPLGDIPSGTVSFESAELKATVTHGTARIDVAKATTPQRTLAFKGIVPSFGGGLALSGFIAPRDLGDGATRDGDVSAFFVGGSWTSPFVSPVVAPDAFE